MAERARQNSRPSRKVACSDRGRSAPVAAAGGKPRRDLTAGESAGNFRPLISLDLFGEPVAPKRGAGRPRHTPTAATRQKVEELHRAGAKQPAIATALGITVPTLTLNYPSELESNSQAWRARIEFDRTKGD